MVVNQDQKPVLDRGRRSSAGSGVDASGARGEGSTIVAMVLRYLSVSR
jgi:hypothetical protein